MATCEGNVTLLEKKFRASLDDAPMLVKPYLGSISSGMVEVFKTMKDMARRIDRLEGVRSDR